MRWGVPRRTGAQNPPRERPESGPEPAKRRRVGRERQFQRAENRPSSARSGADRPNLQLLASLRPTVGPGSGGDLSHAIAHARANGAETASDRPAPLGLSLFPRPPLLLRGARRREYHPLQGLESLVDPREPYFDVA